MPDFRVADTAPEHPKLRAAGLAAAGLWAMAGAVAMRDLTDGWVADYWVQTWPSGRKHAARLVEVELWVRETRGGIPGYRFHDWLEIQRSASQIEGEKAAARERAKKSRRTSGAAATNVRRTYTAREPVDNRDSGPESSASRAHDARAYAREATNPDAHHEQPETDLPAETADGHGERAPHVTANVRDSLSLSQSLSPSGDLREKRPVVDARTPRNGSRSPNLDLNNPRCARHAHLAADVHQPCPACGQIREQLENADPRAAARAAFRAAVDACGLCDEHGMLELDDGRPMRCDHQRRAS